MAVNKGRHTGNLHWPGGHHHEGNEAERLTPLEETEAFKKSPQSDMQPGGARDTIRVGNSGVRIPERLLEDEREGASVFRLEPVIIFILVGMLAFIGFIAWQITLMPEK